MLAKGRCVARVLLHHWPWGCQLLAAYPSLWALQQPQQLFPLYSGSPIVNGHPGDMLFLLQVCFAKNLFMCTTERRTLRCWVHQQNFVVNPEILNAEPRAPARGFNVVIPLRTWHDGVQIWNGWGIVPAGRWLLGNGVLKVSINAPANPRPPWMGVCSERSPCASHS